MTRKLRVAWYSFSCCEDSTIIFTEMLNDYWKTWKERIEIVYAPVLQKRGEPKDIDIFFVEGAITAQTQEDKLKEFRASTKKMVAIGSCACSGTPSNYRNFFDETTKSEIQNLMIRFQFAPSVKSLKECVTIDAEVNGCPMVEQMFIRVLDQVIASLSS